MRQSGFTPGGPPGAFALVGCSAPSTTPKSASVADAPTAIGVSDGDLWPNCCGADDALHSANGDGSGFDSVMSDIVMNRITGSPASGDLDGEGVAAGDDLGQVWSGEGFTRKPTGMLCVDGVIYLAVQDLAHDFNEAPATTVARSDDVGRTWTWDTERPMFDEGVFTTVWFAGYGMDAERCPEVGFVYAYGLARNWRDTFSDIVEDPFELFLARVPVVSVQDVSTWEYSSGLSDATEPTWTVDIAQRRPVPSDERRTHGMSVLSQGGVTYLPKHDRYLSPRGPSSPSSFTRRRLPGDLGPTSSPRTSANTPGPPTASTATGRQSPQSSSPTSRRRCVCSRTSALARPRASAPIGSGCGR